MTYEGDGTRVVHAGLPEPVPGQPFLPGPVFAGPYHLDPVEGPGVNGYGRPDNPTRRALEGAIGGLEGGSALAFASGQGGHQCGTCAHPRRRGGRRRIVVR